MPRYFFHVIDGKAFLDADGTQCLDDAHAVREAIRTAGQIIRDGSVIGEKWQMTVVDNRSRVVRTLTFSGAGGVD